MNLKWICGHELQLKNNGEKVKILLSDGSEHPTNKLENITYEVDEESEDPAPQRSKLVQNPKEKYNNVSAAQLISWLALTGN